MALEVALAGVRTAVMERLDASLLTVPDSPTAEELAAKRAAVAELWRQFAGEWGALLRLAARAALGRARMHVEHAVRALAASADVPETATQCAEGGSRAGRFADVTDEDVAEGARRLADAGDVSPNTRRAYGSALRGLDAWLDERRPGRALDDAALAEYLTVLDAKRRCASSAAQVVAAAKRRANLRGETPPAGAKTRKLLRSYRRAAGPGRGQVRGISWEEADRMRDRAAAAGDARGLRDAALIAVASDALLRVSEVSNVQVADVSFEDDGTARLLVRRGKTERAGRGELLFLGPAAATRVRKWTDAAGIRDGALFRRVRRGGAVAKLAWARPPCGGPSSGGRRTRA